MVRGETDLDALNNEFAEQRVVRCGELDDATGLHFVMAAPRHGF